MSTNLQERLEDGDIKCICINYYSDIIKTKTFLSEERYNDYKNGSHCIYGYGLYDNKEELCFYKLDENILFIIEDNGIEKLKIKYKVLHFLRIKYAQFEGVKKKYRTSTLYILKNEFSPYDYIVKSSLGAFQFKNSDDVKKYFKENFLNYKITEGSFLDE